MNDDGPELAKMRCKPSRAGEAPLAPAEIARLIGRLPGWEHRGGVITKTFRFPDYWHTMAFVNATAWISHREDHHPELTVGYDKCRVEYRTHAVAGLTVNDFICAAKVEALFSLAPS